MSQFDPRTRYAALVLLVALAASLLVAYYRWNVEARANRVEIAMDYQDFITLARAYNYNPEGFLVALRRAGLTSLATTEELGVNVGDDGRAQALSGAQIINAAAVAPIRDPLLARLVASKRIDRGAVYLLINDRSTFDRFRSQLALHFEPKSVVVLRKTAPWLIVVHTQIDYFNTTALGIPTDQLLLARKLGLLLIPRFQNDERFDAPKMQVEIDDVLRYDRKVSTVMFFGLRNQVFGYPDHLDDAAAVFKLHRFNFGAIETYDDSQIQKGSETLAKSIPGRTVRVQAIAKTELDKLKLPEVVARYVLGVRERNVRVVYLRPWEHQDGTLTIEQTNVELIKSLADELRADGFVVGYDKGRATPIPLYHGNSTKLVAIVALAVPSIFVLLLGVFGWYRLGWSIAAYALTIMLYGGAVLLHHDLVARSLLALVGALLFETAAILVLAGAFREAPAAKFGDQLLRSAGWTLAATGIALLGALVVVGLLSSPLTMEEIERFRGVKLVLDLPPLIALLLYLFDRRFASGVQRASDVFLSPVRTYQLFVGIAIIAGGVLLVMRSGNDSDVSPSALELATRHILTHVLGVRPRFKEFVIGFPAMMLIPAIALGWRRAVGWLLALAAGVGIGDIVDTFSHLHTALSISLQRVGNGLVIGIIIGALAIWIVRRIETRVAG
jgi:hypothetical protein